MAARYTAIPNLPVVNPTDPQFIVINAIKENVELLTGVRGGNLDSQALNRGTVTVPEVLTRMSGLSARGSIGEANGIPLVDAGDYQNLVRDVNNLLSELNEVRATLNTLIAQLRT